VNTHSFIPHSWWIHTISLCIFGSCEQFHFNVFQQYAKLKSVQRYTYSAYSAKVQFHTLHTVYYSNAHSFILNFQWIHTDSFHIFGEGSKINPNIQNEMFSSTALRDTASKHSRYVWYVYNLTLVEKGKNSKFTL
jgi:hypothetical protein